MKWILATAAIVILAAVVVWQRNSVKVSYVNGLEAYSRLPEREFIVQRDCFVFKFKDRDTTWPLLGARDTVPALPAKVEAGLVGADLPEVEILDIVKTGVRFKIVSVRRDESRRGTDITFEILLLDEPRKYARLDAFYLLDHGPEKTGAAPAVLGAYAAPKLLATP